MVFGGFIISLSQWGFRPDSITISLSLLTILFVTLAYLSRRRLPQEEQFIFSYRGFIRSLKTEGDVPEEQEELEEAENDTVQFGYKRFRAKSRTKVSAIRTVSENKIRKYRFNTSERVPPALIKALIITLVLSIIIASAMLVYANIAREKETFTALYILGDGGKAEDYPSVLYIGQPTKIVAGIVNHEHENINYVLQVKLDGTVLNQQEIALSHNEKWEHELEIIPKAYNPSRQKLEFALYKDKAAGPAYRSVHLWVTQEFGTEEFPSNSGGKIETIDFININNPSMDLSSGWAYVTTNESVASGLYMNGTGIYSGRAYVINSTYQGTLPLTNRHAIYQEFQSDRDENVLLSVYLKDTYTKGTPDKNEIQFKQVLLNGAVVWTDGINGNEGWQRLQVPVKVKKGTNTLTFTLLQNRNQKLEPVGMVIDEISFLPVSHISPYLRENNTIEFELPVSYVLPLPKYVSTNSFMVSWNGTDAGSGIAYYNIDYSTDGTTWQRWLGDTTATSAQFNGRAGSTYYFRSRAVDNALNKEPEHMAADTSTSVDVSRLELTLDITPNPTSGSTNLIVESTRPLNEVTCIINSQSFGDSDTLKLATINGGMTWTGKYTLEVKSNYDIEVIGKDFSNNTAYAFGTIYYSTSVEELVIQTYPEKTSGDVEIGVASSSALQDIPTITVKDRTGKVIETEYLTMSDNEYRYSATIDDSITDGTARIIVTAKSINSQNLYEEDSFVIDRIKPTIQNNSPEGTTVNTGSPTIKASYSDDRAGIDRSSVILMVNGIDVTSSADVKSSSISYKAAGLENGQAEVYLSVTDQAGNSHSKRWSFTVSAA
nr:DUF1616 domain-containing protein [Methanolobus chelungpuianus]